MSEQISALMDEEIAVDDAAHLISSMQSSKQAAEAWSQYNLIGDVMRGNQLLSKDFKQNLMLKLDQEPTILAPKSAQVKADQLAAAKDRIPAK
jgi:sigma-E factor negative regulatory protein RseA